MNNEKCGCNRRNQKIQETKQKIKCDCETEIIKNPEPKTDDCGCGK